MGIVHVIATNADLVAGRTLGAERSAREHIAGHRARFVFEVVPEPKRHGVSLMVCLQLTFDPAAIKRTGVFLRKFDVLFLGESVRQRVELEMQFRLQRGDGGVVVRGKLGHAGGLSQRRIRLGIRAVHCFQFMQRCGRRGEAFIGGLAPERLGAGENAGERVVVARGDGVVLVIMATRAADAEAHHCCAHHVDLVGDHVHREIVIHCLGRLGAEREEAGGHEMPIALGIVLGGQQVAGDLLGKKTIVRRVAIEGLNHIIPITPRMRERGIAA